MIGHAGDTVFFHSNLFLIPKEQVGLFVTCNSPGGSSLRNDLRAAFLDRYYPTQGDEPRPTKKETQQRIPGLEGTYESMIYNTSTIEKYFFPLIQIAMKATPNGTLMASFRKAASEVEEVTPYTFRSVSGVPALGRTARWIAGSAAVLMLLFVLLLSMMMSRTNLVEQFFTSIPVPPPPILLLVMPVIAAALTIFVIPLNVLAWLKKYWALQERIHYTLVTVALVSFIWWLDFYNLLGWRF